MAKRLPEQIKPLFELKHDYDASLERFIHEAGMLRDAVDTLLTMGVDFPGADILKKRIGAFDASRLPQTEE